MDISKLNDSELARLRGKEIGFVFQVFNLYPTLTALENVELPMMIVEKNKKERKDAVVLSQSLDMAKHLIKRKILDPRKIIKKMNELIRRKKTAKIDYISIVDLDKLEPIKRIRDACLIALAVRVGRTRLIDNIILKLKVKS